MTHSMTPHDPDQCYTKAEVDRLIEEAIDKHNKTATLISAALGSIVLFFYAHGLLTVVDNLK